MSKSTEPRASGPHSIAAASLGARLNLSPERGDEHAKLLWFVVLSHSPWDSLKRPTWASDTTLAHESGMQRRYIERGLQCLRVAGLVTTPTGIRPGARRRTGRLLVPILGSPVKVLIPGRGAMANLWITCRDISSRPAALVTLTVGLYALAAHEQGQAPRGWAPVPGRMADVRRFVGARKGHGWTQRVRDLEALGLLRRGRIEDADSDATIWLAPTMHWMQHWRAMERDRLARVVHCGHAAHHHGDQGG